MCQMCLDGWFSKIGSQIIHYAYKKMPIIPKIMPLILANNVSLSNIIIIASKCQHNSWFLHVYTYCIMPEIMLA